MKELNNISIYISIGGFIISCLSFINSIRQSGYARKIEKLKAYDKIYFDVCDMLLYEYKKSKNNHYHSDDEDLQRAVNEFGKLHWLEQLYGRNHYDYMEFDNDAARIEFNYKVSEEYNTHQLKGTLDYPVRQSPVFHLDDDEFRGRFTRVMEHLNNNISYFNPYIRQEWEKTYLRTTDEVKSDYEALARVNMMSCEELDESIDDPYLKIFFKIRSEHRLLNRTKRQFLDELLFGIKYFFIRPYYHFKYKRHR